jgi:hypothetical protein
VRSGCEERTAELHRSCRQSARALHDARVGQVERFMREYVLVRCKPSTQRENRRALMFFIDRKLGRRRVTEVTRVDVSEIHQA